MKRILGNIVFFLLLSPLCWAGGNKDKGAPAAPQEQQQQTVPQAATPPAPVTPASPFFTGDGGKGMSIAILTPQTTGLAANQSYLPSLVQGEFVSNFAGFSAISVLDRQRLDEQYAELLSGYYDDDAGSDLGHLAPTDYIMGGKITRTATGYALQMQITKTADKMTTASHSGTFTFAELDNLSGIRRASLDLLEKMGVTLTERTRTELSGGAAANHVNAQTSLAQGITAQKGGTVVEALSRYIQANNYDAGLAEAASRMNILSANISSGNIGSDVRNDLQWRDQWVARLKECEQYYINQMANQPHYLVYSTNIKQGDIDYQRRTVPLSITISLYPDLAWFNTVNQVVNTVRRGLGATGRAKTWGLSWPETGITDPRLFSTVFNAHYVTVEILNSEGKSIASQTDGLVHGWTWGETGFKPVESTRECVFQAVDPNSITDNLTIRISGINGVPAERAAAQRNISIVTADEFSRTPASAFLNQRRQIQIVRTGSHQRGQRNIVSLTFKSTYRHGNSNGFYGGEYYAINDRDNTVSSEPGASYLVHLVDYGVTEITGMKGINTEDVFNYERRQFVWMIIPPTVTSINNSLNQVNFHDDEVLGGVVIPPSVRTIRNSFRNVAKVIIGANVELSGFGFGLEYAYTGNGRKAGTYSRRMASRTTGPGMGGTAPASAYAGDWSFSPW